MKFNFLSIIVFILFVGLSTAYVANDYLENPKYCGDGICHKSEEGICGVDCDWCGDSFCQEDCLSCPIDCGRCEEEPYCGDGFCNKGECDIKCMKDCTFIECQNGFCENDENCVNAPNDCRCNHDEVCDPDNGVCTESKCGNHICDIGETTDSCPNDCIEEYDPKLFDPFSDYPIILLHGHNMKDIEDPRYTLETLGELQNRLAEDGYENKGVILPSAKKENLEAGLWGSNKSVVVRTTYYLDVYDEFGSRTGSEDEKSILVYAERLSKVVDIMKHYTGKNKVIIVAHSMGGLVSRAYIKYNGGESNVDKLIMIGTPNHGTYGLSSICGFFHPGPNCIEMAAGSNFLKNLNTPDETYGDVEYYTIAADVGDDWEGHPYDGLIRVESTKLKGAKNYVVKENMIGEAHTLLIIPSKMPKSYKKIAEYIS